MNKMEKNLQNIFGLPASEPNGKIITQDGNNIVEISDTIKNSEVYIDYHKTRKNIEKLMAQIQTAIDGALSAAEDSENARSYEVVGGLINVAKDLNIQYLENQKRLKDIITEANGDSPMNQINIDKAIFTGSTEELAKMIKQERNNDSKE